MENTDTPPLVAPVAALVPDPAEPQYELCESCAAPLDDNQRYCVVCGTRHKLATDPAARFIATTTSRARANARATAGAGGASTARRRRSPGLGTALVLAVIPLAVGLGVVVGRSGNGADSKLIAALKAQKPEVITSGAVAGSATPVADTATASSSSTTPLTSTFSLTQGYAVELKTLPAGTSQGAATAAEKAAKKKGATGVGVISQSDFAVKPAPPHGDYILYSGQYASRSEAQAALAKLKKAFPSATVISVQSTASGAAGKVVATGNYGSVHELNASKPTSSSLAQGKQVVDRESHQQNQSYVQSQQNLPDVIQVP